MDEIDNKKIDEVSEKLQDILKESGLPIPQCVMISAELVAIGCYQAIPAHREAALQDAFGYAMEVLQSGDLEPKPKLN
jgi:hypothetical protein